MSQYCPHVKSCPFYQNWAMRTRRARIDIIVEQPHLEEHTRYDCLALIAIDDAETGVTMDDWLKSTLSEPDNTKQRCSHITLLNLANEAHDFASWVMTTAAERGEKGEGRDPYGRKTD